MTDALFEQLDRIIDRIVRNDSVLVLERESADWWTVSDVANGGVVMMRADRELCVRFMRAFVVWHPDASLSGGGDERGTATASEPTSGVAPAESAVEFSWRVAQESNVVPLR